MTVEIEIDDVLATRPVPERGLPSTLTGWMTTTDHKAIGVAYAVTALAFMAIGGALAGLMRAELTRARDPGRRGVDVQQHLHHPRQRDGVPVRRSVRVRARQLPRAAPDRRARHGVPAPQRTLVLAVPVRRLHHAARLRQQGRRRRLRLVRLPAAVRPAGLAGPRRRLLDRLGDPDRDVGHVDRDQRDHHRHDRCARPA